MNSILIIIAFNLIIFFRTLRFSICVDDVRHYARIQNGKFDLKPTLKTLPAWIQARLYGGGTLGRARPGEAPDAHLDHLLTICLHTTASVLVYLAFHSFWAAILYSCNPTNMQTSVWLNGRRYLINVILVMLMVIFPIAGIPLYMATGLFHYTAIFAPVLFLGWWSVPVAGLFYLLFRGRIDSVVKSRLANIPTPEWKTFTPKRLIVSIKIYGFHFFKMLFPGITLMNYPTLFMWGNTKEGNKDAYAFNFDFYLGILALLVSVLGVGILPPAYRLWAVFMALAIAQWCAIIPANQLLADRYTSTAMPFMMFFVAYFLPWQACLALAGFYVARLWSGMEMFCDVFHFWKYQLFYAPHITTPRKEIIIYLIHSGDYMKAWHYCREGLEYTPTDFSLLHRAAICAKAAGIRKQALEYVMKAEQNFYIGQEESQKAWCDEFKRQMKQEDLAQLDHGPKGKRR